MDVSTSECSSGCESGWTTYFDHYSAFPDQCNRSFDEDLRSKGGFNNNNNDNIIVNNVETEEEDEDLSMVSDASSGPPHFHEDDVNENYFVRNGGKFSFNLPSTDSRKGKHKMMQGKQQNCCLDDTASSPVVSFSKNVPSFSQGLSGTDSKEKSTLRKHFGFLNPSAKGKSTSEKSGGLQGRKRL